MDAAISGISAGDSRRLSVRAAFPLMIEMEREHGSLIRAMMARRREGLSRLVSFDGGLSTLVEALRARIDPMLRAGRAARAATRRNGVWRIEREDGQAVEADWLVLALPAPRAVPLIAGENPELAATLSAIPFAKVAMVALAYREADVPRSLDGYGYLVAPSEGSDVLGVVWESSLFAERAPAGHVLLRVMLGGARHPMVAGREEAELSAAARAEMAVTLGIAAAPERTWVRRWPEAIAQYERGHLERVATARAQAARSGSLDLCGASYDGASFAGAALSGERSAERVVAAIEAARGGARSPGGARRDAPRDAAHLRRAADAGVPAAAQVLVANPARTHPQRRADSAAADPDDRDHARAAPRSTVDPGAIRVAARASDPRAGRGASVAAHASRRRGSLACARRL